VAMLRRVHEVRLAGPSRQSSERPEAGEVARTPELVHRMLQAAASGGGAVWIGYVNQQGRRSQRTIHPTMVSGGFVIALDDETGERRTFALSRIQEARSAG
jgi:predicted DNA-binding transcriptional regulator YafY